MEATMKHYLVPVDYSDKSVYGLQMANILLNNGGGKLTVLHVLKGVDPLLSDTFSKEERELVLSKYKTHLENFTKEYITAPDVQVVYKIKQGKLCDTIMETSERDNVSLIVMGTSTMDNIKKWIIGTNALRIVTESIIPVLTLKEAPKSNEIKHIVLPIDVTKESREKVVNAVVYAKLFGASIQVVSAYTLQDDRIVGKLKSYQNQVVDYLADHGIHGTSELLHVSDRVRGVLEYTKEHKADLIMITTHQQLELLQSFMGSFAKQILRGAEIPVLSMVPRTENKVRLHMPGTF